MKISLTLAQDLMQEEKETSKAITFEEKKSANPYWGFADNRGWLTRYPLAEMPTVSWTLAFLKAGGSFDSCGVWGLNPQKAQKLEFAGLPGEFVGRMLALLGRVDYINFDNIVEVNIWGFDPQTRMDLCAILRGIQRVQASKEAGVQPKSVRRFGWMSDAGFRRYVLNNIPTIKFADNGSVNGISVYDYETGKPFRNIENPVFTNWVNSLYRNGRDAGERSFYNCHKDNYRKNYVPVGTHPYERGEKLFLSLKAAKIFYTYSSWSKYDSHALRLNSGRRWIGGEMTSKGVIFQIHNELLVRVTPLNGGGDNSKFSKDLHRVRQVAGFSVCKIADTWFVWQGDLSHHVEGQYGLHSVIELAEKRRKRDSLILSLNDVRNDRSGTAGFCLAGTKNFLQDKIPFVYRMVAQYNSWAEIPEDIMETEFHLVSKDIFDGYPSPVN